MDSPPDSNNNSNSSSSEAPPVRSLIGEIASYSLVTSTAQKVSATHQSLCGRVPLYGRLTGAAIASATTLANHAHSFTVVRVTVTKVDDWGLQALDRLKDACPVSSSSNNQESEEVRESKGEDKGGELSLTRSACLAIDTVLSSAEIVCHTLAIGDDGTWSKLVQKVVPRVLLNPVNTALSATGCQLARGRRAVQAWCGDAVALKSNLKMRRKVTPRKARDGWLWVWVTRRISGWTHLAASTLSDPSLAKKRKEPEDGSGTSSDDDGVVTCLLDAIESYQSDQDPDYVPSEKSTTDSMEFGSDSDTSSDDEMKVDDHKQNGLTGEDQPDSPMIVVTHTEPMEVAKEGRDLMDGKTDTQKVPQEKAVDEQEQTKEVSMATSNKETASGVNKEKEGGSSETKEQEDGSSERETSPGEKMESEAGSADMAEQKTGSTETKEKNDNGSGKTQEKETGTEETKMQEKDKALTQEKDCSNDKKN